MTKAVKKLLAVAVTMLAVEPNEDLQAKHDALVALGENATHSNAEYKDLQELIKQLKTASANNTGGDADAKAKLDADAKAKLEEKPLSMAGIRMIGSQWYHKSDGYKKGFADRIECAEHFNK